MARARRWRRPLALLLGVALLLAACGGDGERRIATVGDQVRVHYHGTLDSGEVFDSSRGREPLAFEVASGQLIAGFDAAVRGLAVGESVTVRLEPERAYGERRDDLIIEVPKSQAPSGLTVGDSVQFGAGRRGSILEITDQMVRVDTNHPLAGQALTFEIQLVSIE